MPAKSPLKVHITGVYGLIGNLVYQHLSANPDRYDVYGSGRRTMSSERADEAAISRLPSDHFHIADLSDADAVARAIDGMDAVLHIGAVPSPAASFEEVLSSNITGTHNVLEACRKSGVRRLVYASSIMFSWGYFTFDEPYRAIREQRWDDVPENFHRITIADPPRPTEPYSASKVWAEGYCRTYFDKYGISTICLRIGGVNKENYGSSPSSDAVFCSHRDIVNIFEHALDKTAQPVYDIYYAVSDNRYRWVDMEHTREGLGYWPQDSAEAAAAGRAPR